MTVYAIIYNCETEEPSITGPFKNEEAAFTFVEKKCHKNFILYGTIPCPTEKLLNALKREQRDIKTSSKK